MYVRLLGNMIAKKAVPERPPPSPLFLTHPPTCLAPNPAQPKTTRPGHVPTYPRYVCTRSYFQIRDKKCMNNLDPRLLLDDGESGPPGFLAECAVNG